MAVLRCKVTCTENKESNGGHNIAFHPVYSGSPENEAFFKYTPSLSFALYTVNPDAAAKVEVGREYYVDLTPASPDESSIFPVMVNGEVAS